MSRGLLLAGLLALPSTAAIEQRLVETELGRYQPFTMGVASRTAGLVLFDWNGEAIARSGAKSAGMVRTSSGRDQVEAERVRTLTWESMRIAEPRVTEAMLLRLHRSHEPEKGPFSVCMHREEASTRSLTIVTVDADRARMEYVAGPPCETADRAVASLDLLAA